MKWIGIIGKEVISSLTKLDVSVKLILASLLTLYPFWFISVYLFGENFYNSNPIWITLIMVFCLTLVWHFTVLQFTVLLSELSIIKTEENDNGFLVANLINSMTILSLFMFIAYSNHWSFYKFTSWSFLSLLVSVIILAFSYGIVQAIKDEKAKKDNSEKQKDLTALNTPLSELQKMDENTVQQEEN